MIANQIVLLTGHLYMPRWMQRTPDGTQFFYNPEFTPSMLHTPSRTACETATVILAVARLLENFQKAYWSPFFFYTSMRVIDFLACSLLVFAFVMRLFTALVLTEPEDEAALLEWSRGTQGANAFASLLLVGSFLQVISYNRSLGQALTTLFEMIYDSLNVLWIILVLAVGFGVASAPLLPSLLQLNVSAPANIEGAIPIVDIPQVSLDYIFLMPQFLGLYTILGLLDIGMYADIAGMPENDASLAALILLVFSLFVTVFCMNLLIAKMASRYEDINRVASSYRRYQHIALIKRYKDGGPPCPLNLLLLVYDLLAWLLRCIARLVARCTPASMRQVPAEASERVARAARFTVFSGRTVTRRSAETERSYMRDFLREEQAAKHVHDDAHEKRDVILAGIATLRQAFTERLDKLEAAAARSRVGSLSSSCHGGTSYERSTSYGASHGAASTPRSGTSARGMSFDGMSGMSGTERVSSSDTVGLGNNAFEQLAAEATSQPPPPPAPRAASSWSGWRV